MKQHLRFFIFLAISILQITTANSQDPNNPRWNQDPRTMVVMAGDYKPLPYDGPVITQFTTEPRETFTPMGVLVAHPNVRVHISGTNDYSQSEVPIVSSPVNRNILFGSSNAYTFSTGLINSGVYVSLDGGVTWTGTETLPGASTNDQRGDPGPTISKFGTMIFTHLTSASNFGSVTGMGANRSINNGATWSATFSVSTDANADKNLTTTDDSPSSAFYGQSYFAWTSFSTSPANGRTSRTVNDGVTWSAPLVVNTTPAGHNAQGHDMATGPGGEVYICWTAGITASPFTEDFVGFAKSVNGGASYTATENAFDDNGSRSGSFNGWGIRTNGFPRMAVDKTGGARNGWIYIVTSQLNLAPAGTDADVVIHRSTNGGTTWSGGIRVNQDALNNGKVQFFPAVCVASDGSVNVVYYDNRNFPSVGDSCSVYISRSQDGGSTWADVEIADHHFKPKQMSPFGGGYMGDYIGIAPSVNKVVAMWMDDKAAPVGSNKPSAWTGILDLTMGTLCEDFSGVTFPPSDFTLEYTGTQYWSRQTPSAFGVGSGSAKYLSVTAPSGTVQSLASLNFTPVAANSYLVFDVAYAAYSPGFPGPDTLDIESSINGGTSYTLIKRLIGRINQSGDLNTAPDSPTDFAPANNQWRTRFYSIPVSTNKIRIKGRSGFGNNIWVDNVCVQVLPAASLLSIGAAEEGYYIPTPPSLRANDTIRVWLHRSDYPDVKVDSAVGILQTSGSANLTFSNTLSGNYYLEVSHRNCITTWSKLGGFAYTRGSSGLIYNLIRPAGESFDNNQKLIDAGLDDWGMFSGDIDKNGFIDLGDVTQVYNAAITFTSGYVQTDVTGDNVTDLSDVLITYNNNAAFVTIHKPAGAGPVPPPYVEQDENNFKFENDAQRNKFREGVRLMKQNKQTTTKIVVPNWDSKPPEGYQNNYNYPKNVERENSIKNTKRDRNPFTE